MTMRRLKSWLLSAHFAELLRFAFVGVLNTLTTLAIIYGLMLAHVGAYVANFIGYAAGLGVSFTLNRRWTFKAHHRRGLGLVTRFLLAMGCAYCANLATVYTCIEAGISAYLSQLAGMPAYTMCFYLLSKFFVFRKSGETGSKVERLVQS